MCGAKRGFTLLEMLLACVLLLLVSTLVIQILVPMARGGRQASLQVALQQSATLALNRLATDLSATSMAGLTLEPDGLCLHRLEGVAADGSQMWSDRVILYWWEDGKLSRKTWPPSPPELGRVPEAARRFTPTDAEFLQLLAAPNGTERVLATWVSRFLAEGLGDGSLDVRLELEAPAAGGPERFELRRRLYLRNS